MGILKDKRIAVILATTIMAIVSIAYFTMNVEANTFKEPKESIHSLNTENPKAMQADIAYNPESSGTSNIQPRIPMLENKAII